MQGHIYALYNPIFVKAGDLSLIKIGMTTGSVKDRVDQLNTTGLPEPFEIIYLTEIDQCKKVESYIHKTLKYHRWVNNREFFYLPLWEVSKVLDSIIQEYTSCYDDEYWFSYGADRHIDTSDDF